MINASSHAESQDSMHKIAHLGTNSVQNVPQSALLLEILKTLETQFQEKGLLQYKEQSFYPLWFIAETERNVFLWQNALSLANKDDFEFWIDIKKLAKKREKQLSRYQGDNPFLNPLWGATIIDENAAERETDYLCSLLDAFTKIQDHIHALCHVGSKIRRELSDIETKRIVLLPN